MSNEHPNKNIAPPIMDSDDAFAAQIEASNSVAAKRIAEFERELAGAKADAVRLDWLYSQTVLSEKEWESFRRCVDIRKAIDQAKARGA